MNRTRKDNLNKTPKKKKEKVNKYAQGSKAPPDPSQMSRAKKTPMGKGRNGY